MVWFAIPGIVNSICTAVASIGPALSSFAASVAPTLANALSNIAPLAKALGTFAQAFLQLVEVLKPGESVEEIGEWALQAAEQGITLDRSEDFEAYMEKLRSFELDPEKAANRSLAEKLVAGIGVCSVGLERIFPTIVNSAPGVMQGLWVLPLVNPGYFTPERMQSLLTTGKVTGDVLKYLEKSLSAGDNNRFEEGMGVPYEELDRATERWEAIKQQIQKGE